MSRTRYNIFVLDAAVNPVGEEWRKVQSAPTAKKMNEEVDRLRKSGVTEIRVTEITTREIINTVKGAL